MLLPFRSVVELKPKKFNQKNVSKFQEMDMEFAFGIRIKIS